MADNGSVRSRVIQLTGLNVDRHSPTCHIFKIVNKRRAQGGDFLSAFLKKYYPVIDYLERQEEEGKVQEGLIRLIAAGVMCLYAALFIAPLISLVLDYFKKDDGNG